MRVNTKRAAEEVAPLEGALSWGERELIARFALALRGEGRSWENTMVVLSRVHNGVRQRTVKLWVSDLVREGRVFATVKGSGRPREVSEEQIRCLVGWVLFETDLGNIIKLAAALKKGKTDFGLDVSKECIRLHLHEYGVETRTTGCSTSANIPFETKVLAVQDFIKDLRLHLSKGVILCSIDFTYTSHRTAPPSSLAGKGRKSAAKKKISRHTNCIVTALLSDGTQLESIMYTLNSNFRTDRKKTKRRAGLESHLSDVLAAAGVAEDRIVYDGKLEGEKGTFCQEYKDMIRDFLEYHAEKLAGKNIIFLSDNGNAFKDGEESLIEKLGYGKHIFYPACVHQYLSPNDNRLHGVAKAIWRSMFTDFTDDVKCSVALMECLDRVPAQHIREWFRSNLFLDGGIVRDEDVKQLISGRLSKWSDLHDACINEYKEWAGIGEDLTPEGRRLSSTLDGVYYSEK